MVPLAKSGDVIIDTSPTPILMDEELVGDDLYLVVVNGGPEAVVGDLASLDQDAQGGFYSILPTALLQDEGYPIPSGDNRLIELPKKRGARIRLRLRALAGTATVNAVIRRAQPPVK